MAVRLTLVAAAVLALALSAGSGSAAAATCAVKRYPSQGSAHVEKLPKGFRYNSFPATSGPHHPSTVRWGAYDVRLPQLNLVHNLEHGGVVVQYGRLVPRATVQRILNWYEADPDGIVVAPLPGLGAKVALTAWRYRALCTGFTAAGFDRFRGARRFNGPELLARSAMKPGM